MDIISFSFFRKIRDGLNNDWPASQSISTIDTKKVFNKL